MDNNYGSDFMTIVDEDGTEYELEVLSTLEYNGCTYLAVIPATGEVGTQPTAPSAEPTAPETDPTTQPSGPQPGTNQGGNNGVIIAVTVAVILLAGGTVGFVVIKKKK